jgi:hypothetical protein
MRERRDLSGKTGFIGEWRAFIGYAFFVSTFVIRKYCHQSVKHFYIVIPECFCRGSISQAATESMFMDSRHKHAGMTGFIGE